MINISRDDVLVNYVLRTEKIFNETKYYELRNVAWAIANLTSFTKELKQISKHKVYKDESTRRWYINKKGILEFGIIKRNINKKVFEALLNKLGVKEIYNINYNIVCREKVFGSELELFFEEFNKKVLKQVSIGEYVADFLIDDLVIEYDEEQHNRRHQFKIDINKDEYLLNQGYRLYRVCCDDNISSVLAKIYKLIFIGEKNV